MPTYEVVRHLVGLIVQFRILTSSSGDLWGEAVIVVHPICHSYACIKDVVILQRSRIFTVSHCSALFKIRVNPYLVVQVLILDHRHLKLEVEVDLELVGSMYSWQVSSQWCSLVGIGRDTTQDRGGREASVMLSRGDPSQTFLMQSSHVSSWSLLRLNMYCLIQDIFSLMLFLTFLFGLI